jgi:tryptophan halogenase
MSTKNNMFKNSSQHKQIQRIVILGGGTAGWMTAAALSKLLPCEHFNITLVESDHIATVGVGEATLPHLRFFNQRLGIDEAEFMRATQATFKTGIEFANWGNKGEAYIHPFGDYGKPIDGINFYHYWLKQKKAGDKTSLDEYSFPVMASLAGKFDFPDNDLSKVQSTFSYAYHIDAGLYAKFLRSFSEKLGVKRTEGKVVDVIKRASNNDIEMLVMDDGTRIEGDFFVDCSGFRGQLIEQTLDSGFEDWSHWLPCNSAIAIATEQIESPLPYTKAIAHDAGWQWRIPLQHRVGNGYVYCDKYIDKQRALDTLEQNLLGSPLTEPNFLSFKTGRRKQAWKNNCLAIGLSSGFLEPLESTSIYLVQSAIMKLVELMPQAQNMMIKAKEYNRGLDMEMERIRDFLILHYHVTQRNDSAFWKYCRTMDIPESLKEKMDMFKHTGHIQSYKYGLFLEPSWLAVYIGQGFVPSHYDGRIDLKDPAIYLNQMQEVKSSISSVVPNMPMHLKAIKDFCSIGGRVNDSIVQMSLYGKKV